MDHRLSQVQREALAPRKAQRARYQTAAHSALISGDGKMDAASSGSDYLEISVVARCQRAL